MGASITKQTKRNWTGGPASPVFQNEKFPCHWQSQICCRNIVCPSFLKEFVMRTVFMLNCHALTWAGAVQKPLRESTKLQMSTQTFTTSSPRVNLGWYWSESLNWTKKWFLNFNSTFSITALFICACNPRIIFTKLIWLVERSKLDLQRLAWN